MRRIENTTEAMTRVDRVRDFLADGMVFGGSNAIEMMEADGQKQLCRSQQLPTEGLAAVVAAIPVIRVIGPSHGDALFSDVELPDGWSVVPTDHAMWSDLKDEKGRKRASVGYKAAFYDRWASINIVPRFRIERDYSTKNLDEHTFVVTDCGTEVWRSRSETAERGDWQKREVIDATLRAEAAAWLEQQYPNWQDPGAYWE